MLAWWYPIVGFIFKNPNASSCIAHRRLEFSLLLHSLNITVVMAETQNNDMKCGQSYSDRMEPAATLLHHPMLGLV